LAFAVFPAIPADAATITISDQASCEALGGLFDYGGCRFYVELTVNAGDVLQIDIPVQTDRLVTNNGTVNIASGASYDGYDTTTNNGLIAIASGGRLSNRGTLTNNGTITAPCGSVSGPISGNQPQYPDCIPPMASPTQSPAANAAGWNTSDVTVNWNWTDNTGGSGVDPANCTTSSTSSGEGTLTLQATCKDLAGNTGNASYSVKVDKTPPTISAAATTAPNANGWYSGPITVHFTCAHALSRVASCPADQVLNTEVNAVSSTPQTATDAAGNVSASSNVVTVQIDKTLPTISAAATTAPNANGWYNASVTVHFTCNDALSGIPSGTCPADQVLNTEGSAVSSSAQTVADAAGNVSAPSSVVTVKIDKTPPTVAYSGNAGNYTVDQQVQITCSPNDMLSGVASSTCQSISGSAYSFGLGSHSFSATAVDKAGNTGSGSTSFTVIVTSSSLQNLASRFSTDPSVAASLDQDVSAIAQAPNATAKAGALQGFTHLVQAQTGKSLTSDQANILITLANAL
jgi:hypothetical protein